MATKKPLKTVQPVKKVCPKCKTEHTNKGRFCCKSCAQTRGWDKVKPPPEKICPRCGTEHTKKGTFCCKSCAQVRVKSEETKKLHEKLTREYLESPEGVAFKERQRKRFVKLNKGEDYVELSQEDYMIEIPKIVDLDDVRDYLHGDFNFDGNW